MQPVRRQRQQQRSGLIDWLASTRPIHLLLGRTSTVVGFFSWFHGVVRRRFYSSRRGR
jgi:hypothetical protein